MSEKEELKYMSKYILKAQLSLEDYGLHSKTNLSLVEEAYKKHNEYREKYDFLNDEEKLKYSKEVAKLYDKAFDYVGREKFIFYEDGDINYNWEKNRNIIFKEDNNI